MPAPVMAAEKDKPVELSASELAAVQTKTYATTFGKAFPATIATLQSLGYLNINASRDAGTITAETESKGKMIYNILWGIGKKKKTQQASILIEEMAPNQTTIKLNLSINESKSRGIFGNAFKDGELVRFGEPYAEFYSSLSAEMARREAASPASEPVAAAAGPAAAPAASGAASGTPQ